MHVVQNDLVRPFNIIISTTPAAPSNPGANIPYSSSIVLKPFTLLAAGENFKWYASNQTTLLNQSPEFYTGNLTANTTYYVSKTNGYCESAKVAFTVTVDALPVVNAGPDVTITLPVASKILSGSGSDGGSSVTFQWTKLSGPSISMSGSTTATLTLTDITAGSYVFRLAVTDNFGQKVVDDVIFQANSSTTNNNYNYTRQETMMISGITTQSSASGLSVAQKSSTTSYLDELGQPMETVGWQVTWKV